MWVEIAVQKLTPDIPLSVRNDGGEHTPVKALTSTRSINTIGQLPAEETRRGVKLNILLILKIICLVGDWWMLLLIGRMDGGGQLL